MYKSYRVISTTPAGREKNLKLLSKYLLKYTNIIDEHHFWINTTVESDIEYIYNLAKNPFFKAIEPKIPVNWIYSIPHFFKKYTDPNTIYLRFDDDICYIDPDAITNLLDFRIEHPEFFIVYPIIINNVMNKIIDSPANIEGNWYTNKNHIIKKHRMFLSAIENNTTDEFKSNDLIINNKIININCISWLGSEFAKFKGNVQIEEEVWLAQTAPKIFNKKNAICGNALVAHYSFRTQKDFLDRTNIFKKYNEIAFPDIKLI